MTKTLPKTRPFKFQSDLPASNQRALAIGRHNAAELKRLFGFDVPPYKIQIDGDQKFVVIPEFVWDKWYTRPLKRYTWMCVFHYADDCLTTDKKWDVE